MNKVKIYIRKNWIVLFVLILLLVVGTYLRIGGVLTNSFAFTYDVGRDMLQVQQMVLHHKIPLIGQTTGLGGLYYGPWWYYILTPPFIISMGNPQGIVLFMVLTGLLTVVLGFIFGKRVGGVTLGLLIASFLAVSDTMVSLSNQIWNPNLAPLFVLLLFLCFFQLQFQKRGKFLLYACIGFLLGLIIDAEIVFGVLFFAGMVLTHLYIHRKKLLEKSVLGVALGLFLAVAPRLLFETRHNFIMTRSLLAPHEGDQKIFDAAGFFTVLPERLQTFFNQFADAITPEIKNLSYLVLLGVVVVWILFYKKAGKLQKEVFVSCIIILATFLIGSGFFARAVWGHYLVALPVLYIIIVSLTLTLVIKKWRYVGIIVACMLIFLSAKPLTIKQNMENPNWEGNAAVYRNQVAVVDYIYKKADGRQFNYIAYTPVVHDYTYQYLFSWYGSKAYGYNPNPKTEHLFYVIIEPDPGYEGRITDWLKVREGDGKVVTEQVVKGGIKVQTRTR